MLNESGCIAVVDDDPIMGESLQRALELEGWRTVWWHTGKKAVDGMSELSPDLVLCDIRLPDMGGDEVFRVTNARSLAPPFIFMTAYGQIDQAVALVRAGAQDYLTKPFELASLFQKVRDVLALRVRDGAQGALGVSRSMRGIEALLRRLASRSLPILFTGETGTGKEVCARFLHAVSTSVAEPFMAVNCAAIPSDLLESEVFGHERGAFSGAHQRHLGYAERARGGILFLDEIAAMPPTRCISKLLRVLEERSFHRVGGEASIPLKARIVCATSENLGEQARGGAFREDLLYRINAVTVELPPLRERPEDISWLLSRYFSLFAEQAETELRGISSMAEGVALSHLWRGNVRELRNRVERAVNLANGPWIMPADMFPELRDAALDVAPLVPLAAVRDAAEKRQIERVLRETAGHISVAAKRLDISRTTLWEKMRRYGIEHERAIE